MSMLMNFRDKIGSADSRTVTFSALALVCCVAGGSSKATVLSVLVLRPLVVLIACFAMFIDYRKSKITSTTLFWIMVSFIIAISLGLIPLPFDWWAGLPGRNRYADNFVQVNTGWMFISLAPDRTINSLVSIIPAFIAMAVCLNKDDEKSKVNMLVLVSIGTVSAMLGIIQSVGGAAIYLYPTNHVGLPIGLFANRNHQAVFMCCIIPICFALASARVPYKKDALNRWVLAIGGALLFSSVVLVSGSRTGAILLGISTFATACGVLFTWFQRGASMRALLLVIVLLMLAIGVLSSFLYFGRALSVDRLDELTILSDQRLLNAPTIWQIILESWPLGTGWGSFDPVFRGYELDSVLRPTYLNNAHNDLLELAMTGGAAGVAVLAVFLVWLLVAGGVIIFAVFHRIEGAFIGYCAWIGILVLLLASLTDYPLRTPLLGIVFVALCCLLSNALSSVAQRGGLPSWWPTFNWRRERHVGQA